MRDDLIKLLFGIVLSYSEIAAASLDKFKEVRDRTYLQFAAYGIHQMTYYVMIMYGVAHDCQWPIDSSYDQLVGCVSNHCEDGGFLQNVDVTEWVNINNTDFNRFGILEDFYAELQNYARSVQRLYNEHIVRTLRYDHEIERSRQRLSNFARRLL